MYKKVDHLYLFLTICLKDESLLVKPVEFKWCFKCQVFVPNLFLKPIIFCSLKDLSVDFDERIRGETADWYPYCSNLVSVELSSLKDFHPPEIKRLLTNTGLKHLRVESKHLSLDEECFKKLVASQLHTIKFSGERDLSGSLMTNLDSPLETNKTVKYLHWGIYGRIYLRTLALRPQPTIILFLEYFRGLVHLTIDTVTDSILQSIFRWQVGAY